MSPSPRWLTRGAVLAAVLFILITLWTDLVPWRRDKPTPLPASYVEVPWKDLSPKDWDPFKDRSNLPSGPVAEGSGQERDLMRQMRQLWDEAPTVASLDRKAVRIAGYVVPLDATTEGVRQFLLVPYFGACIHSPPPPANQIIHVRLNEPVRLSSMQAAWVHGVLRVERRDSTMGKSGYTLEGHKVEPFR